MFLPHKWLTVVDNVQQLLSCTGQHSTCEVISKHAYSALKPWFPYIWLVFITWRWLPWTSIDRFWGYKMSLWSKLKSACIVLAWSGLHRSLAINSYVTLLPSYWLFFGFDACLAELVVMKTILSSISQIHYMFWLRMLWTVVSIFLPFKVKS